MTRTALMQNSLRAAAALAPLLFLAPGHAQSEIPGFIAPTATATYTISPEGLKPGAVVLVALQIKTTPGWHVYWVNPGDSGLPTHITWTTPKNVTALFTRFPTPIRFQSEGSTSYGFQDGMTALTQMRVSGPRQPLASDLKAHVDLLLCANACVPEHIEASPTGLTGAEALSVINVAETTMPAHAGIAGTIEIDHGRAEIGFERTDGKSFGPIQGAYFYPSKPNILNANAPQHVWVGNTGFVISTGSLDRRHATFWNRRHSGFPGRESLRSECHARAARSRHPFKLGERAPYISLVSLGSGCRPKLN